MIHKEIEEYIRSRFSVRDPNYVSKRQLMTHAYKQNEVISKLALELFCENPEHDVLSKLDHDKRATYEEERQHRLEKIEQSKKGKKSHVESKTCKGDNADGR